MKVNKILWAALGFIGLGLGALGAAVPLLPAFPFLLLAALSFARSSRRLHGWFIATRIYKDNLESYLKGRGMTRGAKLRMSLTLSLTMGIGLYMMRRVPVGQLILGIVWLCHILYFIYGIRTIGE